MKYFIFTLLFTTLISGISLTQNNNQKEENKTSKENQVNSTELKNKDLNSLKSVPVESKTPDKKSNVEKVELDTLSSDDKEYHVQLSSGAKRSDPKTETDKKIETNESSSTSKKQNDISSERSNIAIDIHKKTINEEVVLILTNEDLNFKLGHTDEFIVRVKNHFEIISSLKFSEEENHFEITFSDINITEKTDLLNEVLNHFGIKNYNITY